MSTRGWYEYYVLDEASRRLSLSMQFYKWGDAVPENALGELLFFNKIWEEIDGRFPVSLLDDMLREQLGPSYRKLPAAFSTACYLFLVQRAREELSWSKRLRYANMPAEERPDFKYGYQIGLATARHGFPLNDTDNEYVRLANSFIAAGKYVRPWADCALRFNILQWIQYLTQDTMEVDMGSIAGSFSRDWDISFIYRFFLFAPERCSDRSVEDIRLQLCDQAGNDLVSGEPDGKRFSEDLDEWRQEMIGILPHEFVKAGKQLYSLEKARESREMVPSPFWGARGEKGTLC